MAKCDGARPISCMWVDIISEQILCQKLGEMGINKEKLDFLRIFAIITARKRRNTKLVII